MRTVYDGSPFAIEVQLANTQIPIIIEREDFYDGHAYHLLWLTWNFEPPAAEGRMRSSDAKVGCEVRSRTSSTPINKNLFSIDDETIALSWQERSSVLRVFWKRDDAWQTKLVKLAELHWLLSGRAFVIAPQPLWHEDFLGRWRSATGDHGTQWAEREQLSEELAARLALPGVERRELEDADSDDLINCLLSLVNGRPFGSRQRNLTALLNTFLGVERRHRFARLVRRFAERCGRQEVLGARSVEAKLDKALAAQQDGPESLTGRIALSLFPDVFERRTIGDVSSSDS